MKYQTLENKFKNVLKENVTLDADLQVASQTIVWISYQYEILLLNIIFFYLGWNGT